MLRIDVHAAPPTSEQIAVERRTLVAYERRGRMVLVIAFIGLLATAWVTRDDFSAAIGCGLGFCMVIGLLLLHLLRWTFLQEFLRPATPAQCLTIVPVLLDEATTRYVAEVQRQGRLLTAREASAIRDHGAAAIKRFLEVQAAEAQSKSFEAWQQVNGRPYTRLELASN